MDSEIVIGCQPSAHGGTAVRVHDRVVWIGGPSDGCPPGLGGHVNSLRQAHGGRGLRERGHGQPGQHWCVAWALRDHEATDLQGLRAMPTGHEAAEGAQQAPLGQDHSRYGRRRSTGWTKA